MTVTIACIAHRPFSTIYPISKVTPSIVRIVQQVVLTHVVLARPVLAVPVLPAVVRVRVPSVRKSGTVHLMVAGNSCGLAVVVAGTANWTVATLDRFRKVAPNIDRII